MNLLNTEIMRKNIENYVERNCSSFELPYQCGRIVCNDNHQLFRHLLEISDDCDWNVSSYFKMQKHFNLESFDIEEYDNEAASSGFSNVLFVPDDEEILKAAGYEDIDELRRDVDRYFNDGVIEYYEEETKKWLEEHPYIRDTEDIELSRLEEKLANEPTDGEFEYLISLEEGTTNDITIKHFNLDKIKVEMIWVEKCQGDGYTYDVNGYHFDNDDIPAALQASGYNDIDELCADMLEYNRQTITRKVEKLNKIYEEILEDLKYFGYL